jgi:hypothetical protein
MNETRGFGRASFFVHSFTLLTEIIYTMRSPRTSVSVFITMSYAVFLLDNRPLAPQSSFEALVKGKTTARW